MNGAKEERGKVEGETTGEEYHNEGAMDVEMKSEEEGQEKSETRERSVEVTLKQAAPFNGLFFLLHTFWADMYY